MAAIEGGSTSHVPKQHDKYYAVAVGVEQGIFLKWATCEQAIKHFPGALHKRCPELDDACAFLNNHGISTIDIVVHKSDGNGVTSQTPLAAYCEQSQRACPAECVKRSVPLDSLLPDTPTVYCDGACIDNGGENPLAGYGVYWGPESDNNVSGHLYGSICPTNNRAELTAAIVVLKQAREFKLQKLIVCSDSKYVIDGITCHLATWKRLGELPTRPNKDLWIELDSLCSGLDIHWRHVAGHAGIQGNIEADRLANEGASNAMAPSANCALGPSSLVPNQNNCPVCQMDNDKPKLQCSECRRTIHYHCTNLPRYQVFLFWKKNRKFQCNLCTVIPSNFYVDHESMNASQVAAIKHTENTSQCIPDGFPVIPASIQCSVETSTSDLCITGSLPVSTCDIGTSVDVACLRTLAHSNTQTMMCCLSETIHSQSQTLIDISDKNTQTSSDDHRAIGITNTDLPMFPITCDMSTSMNDACANIDAHTLTEAADTCDTPLAEDSTTRQALTDDERQEPPPNVRDHTPCTAMIQDLQEKFVTRIIATSQENANLKRALIEKDLTQLRKENQELRSSLRSRNDHIKEVESKLISLSERVLDISSRQFQVHTPEACNKCEALRASIADLSKLNEDAKRRELVLQQSNSRLKSSISASDQTSAAHLEKAEHLQHELDDTQVIIKDLRSETLVSTQTIQRNDTPNHVPISNRFAALPDEFQERPIDVEANRRRMPHNNGHITVQTNRVRQVEHDRHNKIIKPLPFINHSKVVHRELDHNSPAMLDPSAPDGSIDVLIVGNSQTRQLVPNRMFWRRKTIITTLPDGQKDVKGALRYIAAYNGPVPSIIVLHVVENTLANHDVQHTFDQMFDLIHACQTKFPRARVFVPEALPRFLLDKRQTDIYMSRVSHFNKDIARLNVSVIQMADLRFVNDTYFDKDGVHLNNHGRGKLVMAYRAVISPALGIDQPTYWTNSSRHGAQRPPRFNQANEKQYNQSFDSYGQQKPPRSQAAQNDVFAALGDFFKNFKM